MIPLGRYQLHSPIGSGGSSTVYLAKDTGLDREVAIKCFDIEGLDSNLIQRLRNEAVVLAQLNHPNIVQMYDVVEDEKTLGLVMEFARGATLAAKLKERVPEQKQALGWLIQIAEGLNKAHQSGIIHCDLKLENVIVTVDGTVKIADFGIAKAKRDNAAEDGQTDGPGLVSGSYFSLSPEQARGENVDFRTDVFSFGILSYQLLTGRHPFGSSKDPKVIAQRIVNERFEFASSDSQTIPQTIMQLLSVLLEKRPEDRPANIAIVAPALKQALDDSVGDKPTYEDATVAFEAIKPQKVSLWSRAWFKRILVGSALAMLTVAVFLAWPTKVPEVQYVAVLKPVMEVVDGFDEEQKRHISKTIETSIQEGILNSSFLRLIPNNDLSPFDGHIPKFANAVAADSVLKVEADCNVNQCQLVAQKLQGDKWTAVGQQSWPVLTQSLSDIRSTSLSHIERLYSEEYGMEDGVLVDEETYRSYIDVYLESSDGSAATVKHLRQLEALQRVSGNFLPLYDLYMRSSIYLFDISGEKKYLEELERYLAYAPASLAKRADFRRLEFALLLAQGNIKQSQSLLNLLEKQGLERVELNDLKGDLASQLGDFKNAVLIERENVLLRPSYSRYYNLALSEYEVGNFELAKQAGQRALKLAPSDLDVLNLVGVLSIASGDLDGAISSYKKMINRSFDSYSLSNLGVSLMLSGRYTEAIKYQEQALSIDQGSSSVLLNLADSHNLLGNKDIAAGYYRHLLDITREIVDNDEVFSERAQAYAHIGEFNQALKTLKLISKDSSKNSSSAYASSIVHSLSGNHNAAIVEVENAILAGVDTVWFHLAWFDVLCSYQLFTDLVNTESRQYCSIRNF